jgi:hypothetical protein
MSKVVAAIEDPYNLEAEGKRKVDFEIGAFVEVALRGRSLARVVPIPAEALHPGAKVWVLGKAGTLEIRPVITARVTYKEALITSGLRPGERVVLSHVPGAVNGMRLRVRGDERGKGQRGKGQRGKGQRGKGQRGKGQRGKGNKPVAKRSGSPRT